MGDRVLEPRIRTAAICSEVVLLAALVVFTWQVARSALLEAHPQLFGYAILVDLTFTASVCHWLLGIRLAGLPRWTFIPLVALGLALSRALLPADVGATGPVALVALAVVEGSALVLLAVNLRKITREVRAARARGTNGFDALEAALLQLAPSSPRLVAYARFEIQLWTMFVLGWFWRRRPADGRHVFTHHKANSWFAIVGLIAFLVVVEAAAVHWILHTYHFTAAKWIASASSFYAFVWLIGDLQALRVYRSSLREKDGQLVLDLRMGARGHADIALSNIAGVETGAWEQAGTGEERLVLCGPANVKLSFHAPNLYKPMFGGAKQIRALLSQIDDPEAFKRALCASSAAHARGQAPRIALAFSSRGSRPGEPDLRRRPASDSRSE